MTGWARLYGSIGSVLCVTRAVHHIGVGRSLNVTEQLLGLGLRVDVATLIVHHPCHIAVKEDLEVRDASRVGVVIDRLETMVRELVGLDANVHIAILL